MTEQRPSSRILRTAMLLGMVAALGLGVAACGKKGPLEPPTDAGNQYPRTYPSQ